VLRKFLTSWAKSPKWLQELSQYLVAENYDSLAFGDLGIANSWKVVNNTFAYSELPLEEKWKLFEIVAKRDGTDNVQKQRRYINALIDQDREKLWNYFVEYNKEEST
jgi:hypothetical protein